jgi:hypothetical protein
MNSAGDLPKEGLPHSDICGSTIARISPQLFAACHVLHRLLAPRHPPNALVSLTILTPAARTQDQTAPHTHKPTKARSASPTLTNSLTYQSQIHNFNDQHRASTPRHPVGLLEATCLRRSTRCPVAEATLVGHRERRAEPAVRQVVCIRNSGNQDASAPSVTACP